MPVRFTPGTKRWLETQAGHAGAPTSSFLRAKVLEGIFEQSRLEMLDETIQGWIERAGRFSEEETSEGPGPAARVRRGMEELAEEILGFVREETLG